MLEQVGWVQVARGHGCNFFFFCSCKEEPQPPRGKRLVTPSGSPSQDTCSEYSLWGRRWGVRVFLRKCFHVKKYYTVECSEEINE